MQRVDCLPHSDCFNHFLSSGLDTSKLCCPTKKEGLRMVLAKLPSLRRGLLQLSVTETTSLAVSAAFWLKLYTCIMTRCAGTSPKLLPFGVPSQASKAQLSASALCLLHLGF